MVAVLCVALVMGFPLVKGLRGISWSSFSMISFILSSDSVSETAESSGTSKGKDFLNIFYCFRKVGILKLNKN